MKKADRTKKGMIFNIQKFSVNDGPGIRTVVFLKGCPLHCAWCANPESQYSEMQVLWNMEKCVRCHHCVKICPKKAITFFSNEIKINPYTEPSINDKIPHINIIKAKTIEYILITAFFLLVFELSDKNFIMYIPPRMEQVPSSIYNFWPISFLRSHSIISR